MKEIRKLQWVMYQHLLPLAVEKQNYNTSTKQTPLYVNFVRFV